MSKLWCRYQEIQVDRTPTMRELTSKFPICDTLNTHLGSLLGISLVSSRSSCSLRSARRVDSGDVFTLGLRWSGEQLVMIVENHIDTKKNPSQNLS